MNKIFIIAEAGVNHNGKIDLAYTLIDEAVKSGVNAIKFQTFKSEAIASKFSERAKYQKNNMSQYTESQLEMIKRYELSYPNFIDLKKYCDKKGILFLTSTADFESTDFIENYIPAFKVSSADLTNIPFLKYLANKNKPVILSTGMGNLSEIEKAVSIFNKTKNEHKNFFPPITLLHCTTNYPCAFNEVNLNAMSTLRNSFHLPVGYSDHSLGIEIPIAAAALGATIIEKHFTLDKLMEGPDHSCSLEPDELKRMVNSIRNIEEALGNGIKMPNQSEREIMNIARKSLVVNKNVLSGEKISAEMVSIKRPGTGIVPEDLEKIIGLTINKNKLQDETIYWEDFK